MGRSVIGIIGAAVSGPVLALQILSHPILSKRFRPILFDQISAPQEANTSDSSKIVHTAGAGVGLFPNGLHPLYELGLKDSLHAISCEMQRLSIWRGNLEGQHRFCNSSVNAGWAADLGTCTRVFERQRLQHLLLTRVRELGGQVGWGKKIQSIESLRQRGRHGSRVHFTDGESTELDLLIGADGAWSAVRRYILNQRDPKTGHQRWAPRFTGVAGLYGISSSLDVAPNSDPSTLGDLREAYMVLLDRGNIGALPLEDGKVAWTIHHPETEAPERSTPIEIQNKPGLDLYESKMVPGVYSPSSTAEILRRHENIWHPTLGSFKPMFQAAERIIRSPLRLSVWEPEEIQWGNVAVIGDAARVLPPYAGQGASFGVEDATVLANALLNNPPPTSDPKNFQAALTEYAQTRVPRSKKVAKMASWTGVLSMGSNWWWRWLRDLGSRLPLGGDPKTDAAAAKKQDLPWLFGERLQIKVREPHI